MARETEKLQKAMARLGLVGKPDKPNIVYYGRLAEQGYTWDGDNWVRKGAPVQLTYPVQVRVMAEQKEDLEMMQAFLFEDLSKHGFHVSVGGVYPNHTGSGWRTYLDIE